MQESREKKWLRARWTQAYTRLPPGVAITVRMRKTISPGAMWPPGTAVSSAWRKRECQGDYLGNPLNGSVFPACYNCLSKTKYLLEKAILIIIRSKLYVKLPQSRY